MNRSGTLVLGLDQEPATLDPHASPSAVAYQIIASVTRPTASSRPWEAVRAKLLVSARPAVMVRGVASVGDRSLLPPAPRAPAPIRAPPRLRPPLP
jgi:hypothetical protein